MTSTRIIVRNNVPAKIVAVSAGPAKLGVAQLPGVGPTDTAGLNVLRASAFGFLDARGPNVNLERPVGEFAAYIWAADAAGHPPNALAPFDLVVRHDLAL